MLSLRISTLMQSTTTYSVKSPSVLTQNFAHSDISALTLQYCMLSAQHSICFPYSVASPRRSLRFLLTISVSYVPLGGVDYVVPQLS